MEVIKKHITKNPLAVRGGAIFVLALFIFGALLVPSQAHAFGFGDILKPLKIITETMYAMIFGAPIFLVYLLLSAAVMIFAFLPVFFAGIWLNLVITGHIILLPYTSGGVVDIGWPIMRDVANLLFIAILLVMAVRTILGSPEKGVKLLPKLIAIALIINFTKVIAGVVVDVGNIITNYFLSSITDVGNLFMQLFGPATPGWMVIRDIIALISSLKSPSLGFFLDYIEFLRNNFTPEALIRAIMGSIMLIIVGLMMAFTLVVYTFVFLLRYIKIWILVIFSPLAFAAMILPETSKYTALWWQKFTHEVFIGVGPAFMLFLVARMINLKSELGLEADYTPYKIEDQGFIGVILEPMYGLMNDMLVWIVILIFMWIGLSMSLKMNEKIAKFSVKWGNKLKNAAFDWGKRVATQRYGDRFQAVGEKMMKGRLARAPGPLGGLVRGGAAKLSEMRAHGENAWKKEQENALKRSTGFNLSTVMTESDPDKWKGSLMGELEKDRETVMKWLKANDAQGSPKEKEAKIRQMIAYMSRTGRERELLWSLPQYADSSVNTKLNHEDNYDLELIRRTRLQAGSPERITEEQAKRQSYAYHMRKERVGNIVTVSDQNVYKGLHDNKYVNVLDDVVTNRSEMDDFIKGSATYLQNNLKDPITDKSLTDESGQPITALTEAEAQKMAHRHIGLLTKTRNIKSLPEDMKEMDSFIAGLIEKADKISFDFSREYHSHFGPERFNILMKKLYDADSTKGGKHIKRIADNAPLLALMSADLQKAYRDFRPRQAGDATTGGQASQGTSVPDQNMQTHYTDPHTDPRAGGGGSAFGEDVELSPLPGDKIQLEIIETKRQLEDLNRKLDNPSLKISAKEALLQNINLAEKQIQDKEAELRRVWQEASGKSLGEPQIPESIKEGQREAIRAEYRREQERKVQEQKGGPPWREVLTSGSIAADIEQLKQNFQNLPAPLRKTIQATFLPSEAAQYLISSPAKMLWTSVTGGEKGIGPIKPTGQPAREAVRGAREAMQSAGRMAEATVQEVSGGMPKTKEAAKKIPSKAMDILAGAVPVPGKKAFRDSTKPSEIEAALDQLAQTGLRYDYTLKDIEDAVADLKRDHRARWEISPRSSQLDQIKRGLEAGTLLASPEERGAEQRIVRQENELLKLSQSRVNKLFDLYDHERVRQSTQSEEQKRILQQRETQLREDLQKIEERMNERMNEKIGAVWRPQPPTPPRMPPPPVGPASEPSSEDLAQQARQAGQREYRQAEDAGAAEAESARRAGVEEARQAREAGTREAEQAKQTPPPQTRTEEDRAASMRRTQDDETASQKRVSADEQRQQQIRDTDLRNTLIKNMEQDVRAKAFEVAKALGNRTPEGRKISMNLEDELKALRGKLKNLRGE